MYKAIAEMYEESHDADKALEYYHKAGETFRGDVRLTAHTHTPRFDFAVHLTW